MKKAILIFSMILLCLMTSCSQTASPAAPDPAQTEGSSAAVPDQGPAETHNRETGPSLPPDTTSASEVPKAEVTPAETRHTETTVPTETKHVHQFTKTVSEPTCTEDGYTLYRCPCGDSRREDEVPALGHAFGEWTVTAEPTYDAEGQQQRTCSRCGYAETQSIPPVPKPPLDLKALCQYGIDYAVSTYGYKYWPGMRDGWYPPFTAYIPDMESGYAAVRAGVDSNTRTLEARGEQIVEYIDGVGYGMPFDIEIIPDPDGFTDSYLIYIYY